MPQIAQQDYIRIDVAFLDSQDGFTSEEKALIRKNLSNWPDIILSQIGNPDRQCRIISVFPSTIVWYDLANSTIAESDISE